MAPAPHRRVDSVPPAPQRRSDVSHSAAPAGLTRRPPASACRQPLRARSDPAVLLGHRPCTTTPLRASPAAFVPHQPHRPARRRQVHQHHSPLANNNQPHNPHGGLSARQRTCTPTGSSPSSSTPRTSTSPSPTNNPHTRIGSSSTGIPQSLLLCQHRFRGIPRVQPRMPTTITPSCRD